jgi:hypothetical protein
MNPIFTYLLYGITAAILTRAPGNNPDSDETYPAWIAWRIIPAALAAGIAYAAMPEGTGAGASFAFSAIITAVAQKAMSK